jgi:hypothetical protein
MTITEQQKRFFDTFGFLVLRGAFKEDIGWITEEFEAIFRRREESMPHDGTKRSCIVPFIDQSEKLCTLLDDARICGATAGLLGQDFNYLGGDGNFYVGDTGWHSDGGASEATFLKIAFYLDEVGAESGCLRVIPGSHRFEDHFGAQCHQVSKCEQNYGVTMKDVPAVPLASQPGDVVIFNHKLKHAAFGGGKRRRMFTLNMCEHCRTPEQLKALRSFVNGAARFWVEHCHSEIMRETASAQRLRHLEQVIMCESDLPALVAKAKTEMLEPARG